MTSTVYHAKNGARFVDFIAASRRATMSATRPGGGAALTLAAVVALSLGGVSSAREGSHLQPRLHIHRRK
jgi:threonine/homoserine efflux transporter RhtA